MRYKKNKVGKKAFAQNLFLLLFLPHLFLRWISFAKQMKKKKKTNTKTSFLHFSSHNTFLKQTSYHTIIIIVNIQQHTAKYTHLNLPHLLVLFHFHHWPHPSSPRVDLRSMINLHRPFLCL